MRRICCLMAAVMSVVSISCAHAGAEQLAPGMTEREVAVIMGPPNIVRLERNGVQCLAYQPYERRFTNLIFLRDTLIVAFRLGHLATVDSVYASEIDSHSPPPGICRHSTRSLVFGSSGLDVSRDRISRSIWAAAIANSGQPMRVPAPGAVHRM